MDNDYSDSNNKDKFFYPLSKYYGQFTLQNLVFDADLQEFAQRITYVCALENGGKISPQEAYDEIKRLCEQLERAKREILDNTNFVNEESAD